ncbi:MAG: shikimate dehydrogenase [Gammaproteobacteria bacterium]|nr:shikimate dehydrogenase [Gammaproteobacteria bacterium]
MYEVTQYKIGLLGEHIGESRSPRLHELEGKAQRLTLSYELFDFAELGLSQADLQKILKSLQDKAYAGMNITHPFKQAVISYLDELSDEARSIGAVNTVVFRQDKKIGFNTDYSGFIQAFREVLPEVNLAKVLLLGAGGAGSSVAQALLSLGVKELHIYDSDAEKALALVDRLDSVQTTARVTAAHENEISKEDFSGLVNASPVGMKSNPGMPVDKSMLHEHLWLVDIIYFPLDTDLLTYAQSLGCKTMNGARMAVYQAADAFQLFTGNAADKNRMLGFF